MLFVRSDRLRSGSAGHCGAECQRIYDENAFEMASESIDRRTFPEHDGCPPDAALLGVKPFHAKRAESTDALLFASVELLKEKGIVKEGEIVVATAGVVTRANRHEPVADTNIMRVMVVE